MGVTRNAAQFHRLISRGTSAPFIPEVFVPGSSDVAGSSAAGAGPTLEPGPAPDNEPDAGPRKSVRSSFGSLTGAGTEIGLRSAWYVLAVRAAFACAAGDIRTASFISVPHTQQCTARVLFAPPHLAHETSPIGESASVLISTSRSPQRVHEWPPLAFSVPQWLQNM
ncbi:MAG: hypothetical protein IIA53_04045 [Chloroflexi bacterium]|nr:hypothetical protein [Chloroflexota bacterium]